MDRHALFYPSIHLLIDAWLLYNFLLICWNINTHIFAWPLFHLSWVNIQGMNHKLRAYSLCSLGWLQTQGNSFLAL